MFDLICSPLNLFFPLKNVFAIVHKCLIHRDILDYIRKMNKSVANFWSIMCFIWYIYILSAICILRLNIHKFQFVSLWIIHYFKIVRLKCDRMRKFYLFLFLCITSVLLLNLYVQRIIIYICSGIRLCVRSRMFVYT